jgi:endoglycosylceramidase
LYGDGVAALAAEVKDETNVIGIDLINEPFPGDKFFECVTSCGGRYRQAEAMYTSLTARVNQAAPGLPVWWAPFNIGEPFPGTPAPGANIGYTFHAYCYDTDGGEPVQPDPAPSALCDAVFGSIFSAAESVSSRWNSPTLLGEFGASQSPLNVTRTTQLADEYLFSWMHWHHPGTWPEVVRTQLVRAYAQATAGHPISQHFDTATGDFDFRYQPDETVLAPTSIVLPAVHYPDGYSTTVMGGTVTSEANSGRLTVEPLPGSTEVRVHVQRSAPEA